MKVNRWEMVDDLSEEIGSSKEGKFQRRLIKYKELPEYLQDNEYILDYYRCEWPLKDVFLSAFSWHNETLNIWTHLGGFLIFAAITAWSCWENGDFGRFITRLFRADLSSPMISNGQVFQTMSNLSWQDSRSKSNAQKPFLHLYEEDGAGDGAIPMWPWFVFLLGAMGCLVCSSLSHLLACHSKRFNLFFWRLDYTGISLMIVSSFFPPIYYTFYCDPHTKLFYLATISVLGIIAIVTLLAPALSSSRYRAFRAALFLVMGFSGVIPAMHSVALHWGHPHIFVSLVYELLMGLLYAVGAAFYVSRIPERWKPGAFDIAGHSHQIFHLFVVLAALAHCAASTIIIDFHRTAPIHLC